MKNSLEKLFILPEFTNNIEHCHTERPSKNTEKTQPDRDLTPHDATSFMNC